MATAATAAERILVVRTRFVGDTVLAIPFLRNLRRAFPAARIDVLVEKASGSVLADCPYPDELIVAPEEGGGGILGALRSVRTNAAWLRGRRYDRAYVLKRSLSAILQTRLAGIPWRVGFAPQGGAVLLSRAVPIREHRHEVEIFLDLLRADGLAVDDGRNENWVPAPVAARSASLLAALPADRPRVLLAVRGTDALRFWRFDRWARLVEWLVHDRGCEIVLCGAPLDAAAHRRLAAAVGPAVAAHVHDFSRAVPLREAGGLVARMDLCIGVDTGLVHLAASFGVPVAVLVGPTDPNQWSPWMTHSAVVRSARVVRGPLARLRSWLRPHDERHLRWTPGRASMDDISVADVIGCVAGLLPARPARPVDPPPVMRTIDLRDGAFNYAVVSRSAAAVPATKPLAHAH